MNTWKITKIGLVDKIFIIAIVILHGGMAFLASPTAYFDSTNGDLLSFAVRNLDVIIVGLLQSAILSIYLVQWTFQWLGATVLGLVLLFITGQLLDPLIGYTLLDPVFSAYDNGIWGAIMSAGFTSLIVTIPQYFFLRNKVSSAWQWLLIVFISYQTFLILIFVYQPFLIWRAWEVVAKVFSVHQSLISGIGFVWMMHREPKREFDKAKKG